MVRYTPRKERRQGAPLQVRFSCCARRALAKELSGFLYLLKVAPSSGSTSSYIGSFVFVFITCAEYSSRVLYREKIGKVMTTLEVQVGLYRLLQAPGFFYCIMSR